MEQKIGGTIVQRKATMMNASFPRILLDEAEKNSPPHLLSKADFLHAVKTLAGKLTAEFTTDDMENVSVACPYDTWKQTFGELRDLREYRGIVVDPPIEVWEQPCNDGTVHCVGYFVDDPHDGQCVVLRRVCLF